MTPTLLTAGHVLLAAYFILSGAGHFRALKEVSGVMAKRSVPAPRAALIAGSVFEIVAGLMLALRWQTIPAAVGLIVFTLAASVIALDFWNQQGEARTNAINAWLANLAVIGGLLLVIAAAWPGVPFG